MDEQEKRAERMIKLTICLCGLLIFGNAGQAVLSAYAAPGEYLLHKAVASVALWGKKLYLPTLTTEEKDGDISATFLEQAAVFLGWEPKEEERVYIEDEYTRQELIEAGRGGSLSDIRHENEKASYEHDGTNKEEIKSQIQNEEDNYISENDPVNKSEKTEKDTADNITGETNNISADNTTGETNNASADNTTGETNNASADNTIGSTNNASTNNTTDSTKNTAENSTKQQKQPSQFLKVYDLATAEKTMTSQELLKKYFIVDPVTKADETLINFDALAREDLSIEKTEEGKKQILIYHTHSQEGFCDSLKNDPDTTIVGAGSYLTRLLTEKGYQVLHLTDTFDLNGGEIDRNKAYTKARKKLEEVIAENPSLQVILDIHRDGVPENKRLVTTVDGRNTAKIMFFNGMSYKNSSGRLTGLANPYIQQNLAFSFQAEYLCDYLYPGFSRCIYLKAYRYNMDLLPRSMLVEVGAQTNTVQEAKNAMIPLADVLDKLLQGA